MAARIKFHYKPAGDTLRRFHCDRGRLYRTLLGPLGSGKTTACCVEIYDLACQQAVNQQGERRSRWAVIRNTYPDLSTTTIPSWRGIFGEDFGPFRMGTPPSHNLNILLSDETRVRAEILFLALDSEEDVRKIRGLELTGAWINEAREVPKGAWDMLAGRVGRYPAKRLGGPSWSGVIADTNMPDEDHWLYKFAEEDRPEGWAFYRQPGGVLREGSSWVVNEAAENVDNLPDGYYHRQLAGKSDDWIKVYLAAEYGFVSDGRPVYPEYIDKLHCSEEMLAPMHKVAIDIGVDFGLTPAAVFGQRLPSGRVVVFDELVATDMGAKRFAQELNRHIHQHYPNHTFKVTGDPAGDQRSQTDETTPFEILASEGVQATPAHTNDWTIRRESVAEPLRKLSDGAPSLMISPKCKTLRKALAGGYCYRRLKISGEERYKDVPDKGPYSHVADAMQYMMLGLGEGRRLVARDPDRPSFRVRQSTGYDPLA